MAILREEVQASRLTEQEAVDLVRQAYDLCFRRKDYRIPRRDERLLLDEVGHIAGINLSSHFLTDTFAVADELEQRAVGEIQFSGSVVLNMGFNVDVVRQSIKDAGGKHFLVIAPTFANAGWLRKMKGPNVVDHQYLGGSPFEPILKKEVKPVKTFDKRGKLRPEVQEVVAQLIGTTGVLDSGLLGSKQIVALGLEARRQGVPFIARHVIRGDKSTLSEKQMDRLVAAGAYVEFSHMFLRDEDFQGKYNRKEIVAQLEKYVDQALISSDAGQLHNRMGSSECLIECVHVLSGYGLSKKFLYKILVENSRKVLRS